MLKQEDEIQQFQQIDEDNFIKLEQESPNSSTHGHLFLHYITNFHDQSSENQIQTIQPSFQQALQYVQNKLDLRTIPRKEIEEFLEYQPYIECIPKQKLLQEILRRKNILKREYAKKRNGGHPFNINLGFNGLMYSFEADLAKQEEQEICKKKRNRISAQISRDKRKQYVSSLQQNNAKLATECQKTKQENERLKKQIEAFKCKSMFKTISENAQNKLTKLLIFLGIIFLLNGLKNVFEKNYNYRVLQKPRSKSQFIFNTNQQKEMLNQIRQITDYYVPNHKNNKIQTQIQEQIKAVSGNLAIPEPINQNIILIKRSYFD